MILVSRAFFHAPAATNSQPVDAKKCDFVKLVTAKLCWPWRDRCDLARHCIDNWFRVRPLGSARN